MIPSSRHNPSFINTILLGGTPAQNISAAHEAGFEQIEIWQQDVENHEGGPEDLGCQLRRQDMCPTDYQVLRDFDGAPDCSREKKRAEALSMLDVAVQLGAHTVLATASTDPACVATNISDDLRWLATQAALRNLSIAYEGLAWSTINFTLATAWDTVVRVDQPNLGIVIDPFHIFVRGGNASDLDGIPMERIFMVQFSDSDLDNCTDLQLVIDTARHRRLLPGYGRFPLYSIVERLKAGGYTGPVGIEVFNDDMKAQDPQIVAHKAMWAFNCIWPR